METQQVQTQYGKFSFKENENVPGIGLLHSEGDEPAVQWNSGYKVHMYEGKKHREVGPAVITARGVLKWYVQGQLHAVGAPAIIYPSGAHVYAQKGKIHNEKGPAIVSHNGVCYWFLKGKRLSREDWAKKLNIVLDN